LTEAFVDDLKKKETLVVGFKAMFTIVKRALELLNHFIMANMLTEADVKTISLTETLIPGEETCRRAIQQLLAHVPFFDQGFPIPLSVFSSLKLWNQIIMNYKPLSLLSAEPYAMIYCLLSANSANNNMDALSLLREGYDPLFNVKIRERLFHVRSPEYDICNLRKPVSAELFRGQLDRKNVYNKCLDTFEGMVSQRGITTQFIIRYLECMMHSFLEKNTNNEYMLSHVVWVSEGILNINDDLRWFSNMLRMINVFHVVALKKSRTKELEKESHYDTLGCLLSLFNDKLKRFKEMRHPDKTTIKKSVLMDALSSLSFISAVAIDVQIKEQWGGQMINKETPLSYEDFFGVLLCNLVSDTFTKPF
jgi:hypothetical protein